MSVDRTENKNDRKGLAQVGYCLKYLMNFLRPYKGGLILGLLMVVVANITFAVMPVVEGEMTTQLFSDGEAILKGVEGAHVHFDVFRNHGDAGDYLYHQNSFSADHGCFSDAGAAAGHV